jgi:hypothetical protein
MKRLNERYDNENFEILLNFIETELLTVYNKFKI